MDPRIETIVYLIEINLASQLQSAAMAESVGLSVSRLQHLFREETGTTIRKYQQELRIKRARELLLTTHLSVKEIIVAVGAGDKSHFVRDFTKRYGLSPRRYRMQLLSAAKQKLMSE